MEHVKVLFQPVSMQPFFARTVEPRSESLCYRTLSPRRYSRSTQTFEEADVHHCLITARALHSDYQYMC
jgi:hypothetical protein